MFSANASQVSNDVKYIEDFCSVYLRTGTGASQTVTTGVKENTGALVISKSRSAATAWAWYDTFRGATYDLESNSTAAQTTQSQGLTAFNADGHTWGTLAKINTSGATYVDTVLKPTPKFFDVVTYTGDGVAGRQIAHNLGSAPGCIIIKNYSGTDADLRGWGVWHRTLAEDYHLTLNSTAAQTLNTSFPLFGKPAQQTSTYFTVGQSDATGVNATTNGTGLLYVAYLFAHDAGGFGLTGTDNVISCGSWTGTGSAQDVTLGYEPQFLIIKNATTGATNWVMLDNMRGLPVGTGDAYLKPNLSDAEVATSDFVDPTATGFRTILSSMNTSGSNYIYIAIRRGPMKVPTDATKVFALSTWTGSSGNKDFGSQTNDFGTGYFAMLKSRTAAQDWGQFDQLRGSKPFLSSALTDPEITDPGGISVVNNKLQLNSGSYFGAGGDGTGQNYIGQFFRRAPNFFDEVCYIGLGTGAARSHGLNVTPEFVIIKNRSLANTAWLVSGPTAQLNAGNGMFFAIPGGSGTSALSGNGPTTSVTSTTFSPKYDATTSRSADTSGNTYVAYLFASCPGVSKVGSYTGNGSSQTINCGFTGGARFVLIKRTDYLGSWYVWDTARGMVVGTDPYLLLNTNDAEVTNSNKVYTVTGGFQIISAFSGLNESGGTYLYLAIA